MVGPAAPALEALESDEDSPLWRRACPTWVLEAAEEVGDHPGCQQWGPTG